jgi:hypothetical protein
MNRFRVWLRPLGDFCRVRVDGITNAQWLLTRLSRDFVFKTFEPIGEEEGSSCCSFQIPYNPPFSHAKSQRLLAAIPPVQVMTEPEQRRRSASHEEAP